jgi:tRNA 2-thiouridine synthesizing protein A
MEFRALRVSKLNPDRTIDTTGQCCPVPMVETNRAIKQMQPGEVLEVISSDVGSRMDIPAWCRRTGNALLRAEEEGGKVYRYLIRKKG